MVKMWEPLSTLIDRRTFLNDQDFANDKRPHLNSMLMRESLLDKDVQASTETPVYRMLPQAQVVKIGGRSIMDAGRDITIPVVNELSKGLEEHKLIIGTGGGTRSRHVFSVGLDMGMPTGVLAELAQADALGNAHILGTLLAPQGVVAIPPEMFGHLLPMFLHSAPGVIFSGVPPYSLWEHPPKIGSIPPHRTDTGSLLLSECFGCKRLTLVKDVDGVYDKDPKLHTDANFIESISVNELRDRNLETLPFEHILLDILPNGRLINEFQIINGTEPGKILAALSGEHVGTIVHCKD